MESKRYKDAKILNLSKQKMQIDYCIKLPYVMTLSDQHVDFFDKGQKFDVQHYSKLDLESL